jgi:hypothetical protein
VSQIADAELATGMVFGTGAGPRLPSVGRRVPPRAALESAILPALAGGPCLVSFSGGRDSSAVLAVATALARREGLPDPIPVTNRFPAAPATDESRWQERVVAHLRLREWLRLDFGDELDVLGPHARRAMRRHGLLWPFNAHFHSPMLDRAAGGTLLTGIGGDELFAAATASRVGSVVAGRVRPAPRDVARLALAAAPRGARRRWLERNAVPPLPWLTAEGRRVAGRLLAADDAAEPSWPGPRLRWCRRLRYLQVGTESLGRLAADAGVRIAHPLLDERLWAAMAVAAAPWGLRGRADGLRLVLGDLLPGDVLARRDKACFDAAFFTGTSAAFAARWEGADLAGDLVDPAALRAHWSGEAPRPQSYLLLQAAWTASTGGELADAGGDRRHRAPAGRPG